MKFGDTKRATGPRRQSGAARRPRDPAASENVRRYDLYRYSIFTLPQVRGATGVVQPQSASAYMTAP